MNQPTPQNFPEVAFTVEPGIEPYWSGAAEGRLVLSTCADDGAVLWPPRPFCPRHMTAEIRWEPAGGGGVVHSYTVVHRGEGAFAKAAPYVLAYVELDEGPRVLTNLLNADGEPPVEVEVEIGQRVTARFDSAGEGAPVLRFVLVP
ncbi:Zn-ribbon domain-containing OB-fold protein [Nocardia rhamnosiphila]